MRDLHVIGLPVVKLPISRILNPMKSRKSTVAKSTANNVELRTIGQMSSTGRKTRDEQGETDSVEDLIRIEGGDNKEG